MGSKKIRELNIKTKWGWNAIVLSVKPELFKFGQGVSVKRKENGNIFSIHPSDIIYDEELILLMLEEYSNINELFKTLVLSPGGFILQQIEKQFALYKINIDKKVILIILFIIIDKGMLCNYVKYIDYVISWAIKFNHKNIDWNLFIKEIYPLGIPIY
jgi:hypothetical protein